MNYIIENTIGELLKDCKSEKDIEKIKVLDSSCGSGSFLIRAFEVFYDAYQRVNAKKHAGIFHELEIRKKILLHNLFGVDLDNRAVEIAKLNLLLKALEGLQETSVTGRKVLPNLSLNIRCGNSLVSGEYHDEYSKKQLSIFDKRSDYKSDIKTLIELKEKFYKEESNEEKNKIIDRVYTHEEKINKYLNEDLDIYFKEPDTHKPFNYDVAFCEVMRNGGFNCIIGNPPYLKLTSNNTNQNLLKYYNEKYKTFSGGSSKNLFQLFIEKLSIFKPDFFALIVPEALLTSGSNGLVRQTLLENMNLKSIALFDHFVFEDATIGSTIFVAEKKENKTSTVMKVIGRGGVIKQEKKINISDKNSEWNISTGTDYSSILNKISKNKTELQNLVVLAKGMVVQERDEAMEERKTKTNLPFILGKNMSRWTLNYTNYATYNKLKIIGGTNKLAKHIQTPRLLVRRTGNIICATYSNTPELVESTIYILTSQTVPNIKILLPILNSDVLTFYFRKKLITNQQGFPQVQMGQLDRLPIPDLTDKSEKKTYDKLLRLCDEMLLLYQNTEKNKTKISATNSEINDLVYSIYGISQKEKIVIEGVLAEKK